MESEDNRPIESTRVWERLGEHDGRIKSMETGQFQLQQSLINHRAEMFGMVKEIKDEMKEITKELHITLHGIGKQLNGLKKFQWTIIIGGTVVGGMISFSIFALFQIAINHQNLKWLWD